LSGILSLCISHTFRYCQPLVYDFGLLIFKMSYQPVASFKDLKVGQEGLIITPKDTNNIQAVYILK
jgi:hypothetical protein